MAGYLRPRRGKLATATSQNIVLKRGEVFFEVPTGGVGTGAGKIKMGDGTTAYSALPYFLEPTVIDVAASTIAFTEATSTSNSTLLNAIASGAQLKTIIGNVKKLLRNLDSSVTQLNNDLDDVIDGTSIVKFASALKGEKLKLYSDNEGGNLELISPDGTGWNVDAFDNNLRIFCQDSEGRVIGFTVNKSNGELSGKITNSYNSDYAESAKKSDSTSTVDGTNVKLYSNNEGGNLELISPNGTGWNVDAFDNNLRIFTGGAANSFIFRENGDLQTNGDIIDSQGHSLSETYNKVIELDSSVTNDLVKYTAYVESGVDLNTITQSGFYRLSSGHVNTPSNLGAPCDWSQLLVMHGGGDTITQIISDYSTSNLYTRSGDPSNIGGSGGWRTAWRKIVMSDELAQYLPLNGGTMTGGLYVGTHVHLFTDAEGGNLQIQSPNKVYWEMDAYNDNFRIFCADAGAFYSFSRTEGTFETPRGKALTPADFTVSGSDLILEWL